MSGRNFRRSPLLLVLALLVLDAGLTLERPTAHEVPASIEVVAYVQPIANHLRVLLRVPLSGLLNAKLPKEGPGYLALGYVGPALNETALALANAIEFRSGEVHVGPPVVRATRISLPLDRAFDRFASAKALLEGPALPPTTQVFWQQGFADVWLEYPAGPAPPDPWSVRFKLTPLAPTVTTVLRVVGVSDGVTEWRLTNDVGRVWFTPTAVQTAQAFLAAGARVVFDVWRLWLVLACVALAGGGGVRILTAGAAGLVVAELVLTLTGATASAWWLACLTALMSATTLVAALQTVARAQPRAIAVTVSVFGALAGAGLSLRLSPDLQFAGPHVAVAAAAHALGLLTAAAAAFALLCLVSALLGRLWQQDAVRVPALGGLLALLAWRDVIEQSTDVRYLDWTVLDASTVELLLTWALAGVAAAAAAWVVLGVVPRPAATNS